MTANFPQVKLMEHRTKFQKLLRWKTDCIVKDSCYIVDYLSGHSKFQSLLHDNDELSKKKL